MDVDDVSHVGQWKQLLQKQKVALQAAGKRKGERPTDRKSRGQLIHEFMLQSASTSTFMMAQKEGHHMIHQSWVAAPYPPSVAPFEALKKIYLKGLQLETRHVGCYALLRVATPPTTMTAVMAILEDEKDDAVVFQLYQQEDQDHRPDEGVVRPQRVCIVREPYFKIMNDGGYGLRVDHISDVIWLSSDDERVPLGWGPQISEVDKTAQTLKEEGNLALGTGKLDLAIESYTLALQASTSFEMSQVLKLNRSFVSLKLSRFDEALEDVGDCTANTRPSEKGLYRAALSLYRLGRFQESHDTLTNLLTHYPNSDAAKKEIIRTKQRLTEQETGVYDFRGMYKAAEEKPPCLDNATFAGNVQVKASEGRGRGLFTTKDVIAGDLLLCEKAFSYCSSKESKTSLLMNTHTNRMTIGTQADLVTAIVQKMFRNPSLAPAFLSLYYGDYKPVDEARVDGMPVVDTFLVDRVVALNCFGCPRTSLESHAARLSRQPHDKSDSHHTSGLFVKASHINHSCYGNARPGTEIFFRYVMPGPNDTYEKRQEKLQNWGFYCTCTICQQSKKTKKQVLSRRLALFDDLKAAFGKEFDAVNWPQVHRILKAIEKTYSAPASNVPRVTLSEPYLFLTRLYSSNNQQDKAIETAWKVIIALGFTIKRQGSASLSTPFEIEKWGLVEDHLVQAWVHLWTAYAQVAPQLCSKAEEYAKTTYKICVGEDDTFDEKYGKLAHRAIFEGADLTEAFQSMIF
ncbi:MAG: hypothetical protein Q9218_000618 [Villophora microphyllina]